MSLNFLNSDCQELPINASMFGLCDDQNGSKAYVDVNNSVKWIATIKNDREIDIVFTAIDKCIIQDSELEKRSRCDGMLTSVEHIYFVELKEQQRNWIPGAIRQLESTIELFMENHDITLFKHKKAFACNKHHKRFQEIDNELNLRFFRKYKVRIDLQTEIIVI